MMEKNIELPASFEKLIAKEYRRTIFANWDPGFILILCITLICEFSLVLWLSTRPVDEYNEREIAAIRERFTSFILEERKESGEQEAMGGGRQKEDAATVAVGQSKAAETGGPEGDVGQGTREERRSARRQLTYEERVKSRQTLTQQVSRKGILGLLTGTGNAAQGESVQGLFSGSGQGRSIEDLDQILSHVDGLKTGGRSTLDAEGGIGEGKIKGSRSGKVATIDDLVTNRETAVAQALTRKGDLFLESPADIIGRGKKSVSRSPQTLQAVIYSHINAIQYCYERELKRNPTLFGKVVVRITVNPDGQVENAEIITSSLNNSRVERCILARIRLWKDFPPIDPNEGNVTFRQVYAFGI